MDTAIDRIRLEPFATPYAAAAGQLIVSIQREEFGFDIDLARQPDLLAIPAFYQHGAGNFWLALDGERVVGTIALKDIGGHAAALRKMFVAPGHRGAAAGVAARLLGTALDWARRHAVERIVLGTTEKFLAAHRFYEKHGFGPIAQADLPAGFPLMSVDTRFYQLDLAAEAVAAHTS